MKKISELWQQIRLQCTIRPRQVTELLVSAQTDGYDNDRLYYLGGEDTPLKLLESLQVRNHSPSGFSHGYAGSGPAQLSLAICLRLYSRQVAEAAYQKFKSKYISTLPNQDKEFDTILVVPTNPLVEWKLEPVLDWSCDNETDQSIEEELEGVRIKEQDERLQQQHDRSYRRAVMFSPKNKSGKEVERSIKFTYTGLHRQPSFCYLRIVDNYNGKVLVVATDPGDLPDEKEEYGASVTNAAELIATQVCREYSIPYRMLDYVERYVRPSSIHQHKRSGSWTFEETWDRVSFTEYGGRLVRPDWGPVSQQEIVDIKKRVGQ